ncbi:hypothetical protein [Metamycoplasma hominis]|nr:hypothetical protein [Metamycoplasma hominis]
MALFLIAKIENSCTYTTKFYFKFVLHLMFHSKNKIVAKLTILFLKFVYI